MMILFIIAAAIVVILLVSAANRGEAEEALTDSRFSDRGEISRLVKALDGFGFHLVLIWLIIAVYILFKIALG